MVSSIKGQAEVYEDEEQSLSEVAVDSWTPPPVGSTCADQETLLLLLLLEPLTSFTPTHWKLWSS